MGKKASPRKPVVEKMEFLWEILVCAVLPLFQAEIKKKLRHKQKLHLFTCLLHRAMYTKNGCGNFKQPMLCQLDVHYYGFHFILASDMIFIGQLIHFNLIKRSVYFLY